MRTIGLDSFVDQCDTQKEAAEKLNCTAGNIRKHLKQIKNGEKQVLVSLENDSVVDAVIIKPFCKQRPSMIYRPVVSNPS